MTETSTDTSTDIATETSQPTGCAASYVEAGSNYACAVEWVCNSGTQTYQIECALMGGSYACTCSTNTSTLEGMITIDPVGCDLEGGALVIANACGYTLQM